MSMAREDDGAARDARRHARGDGEEEEARAAAGGAREGDAEDDEAWLREAEKIQLKAAGRLRNPGREGSGAAEAAGVDAEAAGDEGRAKDAEEGFVILSEGDLRVAFAAARSTYETIEKTTKPGSDPGLQDDISKCLKQLDMCSAAARRLQVLSKNERLADMDPTTLPFLFINYYAGKLEFKITPADPTGGARLQAVSAGTHLLESFLETCKSAGALDDIDETSLAAYQRQEDMTQRQLEQAEEQQRAVGSVLPPQAARELKMERFRRARQAKARLEEINTKLEKAKGDLDAEADLGRESIEVALDCAIKDALDELDSAVREKEILQHMARMQLQFTPDTTPIPPPAPGKGITITRIDQDMINTRETIRSQVFRPSWRQPTMTIEEFAEIEMREAIEREKREKENREANPEVLNLKQVHEQGLEDDEETLDKATEKDRAWDDWKDDNPKGRGVTKRF